jgi:hypothetical protein
MANPTSGTQSTSVNPGDLMQLLQGLTSRTVSDSGSTQTQTSSGETTSTSNKLDPAAVQAMLKTILEGSQGLASIAGGDHSSGIYNSTTQQQLINDLLARSTAAIAEKQQTTTQTKSPTSITSTKSGTVQKTSAAIDPAQLLEHAATGYIGNRILKSSGLLAHLDKGIDAGVKGITDALGITTSAGAQAAAAQAFGNFANTGVVAGNALSDPAFNVGNMFGGASAITNEALPAAAAATSGGGTDVSAALTGTDPANSNKLLQTLTSDGTGVATDVGSSIAASGGAAAIGSQFGVDAGANAGSLIPGADVSNIWSDVAAQSATDTATSTVAGDIIPGYQIASWTKMANDALGKPIGGDIGAVLDGGVNAVNSAISDVGGAAVDAGKSIVNTASDIVSAPFQAIGNAFGCFITTAVCKRQGKPDNCDELETMRKLRDEWMLPNGYSSLVDQYYRDAPRLCTLIAARPDADKYWDEFYNNYIMPTVQATKEGRYVAAVYTYTTLVIRAIEVAAGLEEADHG